MLDFDMLGVYMSSYNNLFNKAIASGGSATMCKQVTNREQKDYIDAEYSVSNTSSGNKVSVVISQNLIESSSCKDSLPAQIPLLALKRQEPYTRESNVHLPELLTEKQFSSRFLIFFGEINLGNYYFLSAIEQIECFESIINNTAFYSQDIINRYKDDSRGYNSVSFYEITFAWRQGQLYWTYKQKEGVGIIDFVSIYKNTSRRGATHQIARLLNFSMENCFSVFPSTISKNTLKDFIYRSTPSVNIPQYLELENEVYQAKFQIPVNMISGEVEYYFCVYQFHQQSRIIIASRFNTKERVNKLNQIVPSYEFRIGSSAATARFLNRDLINQNPKAKIIWSMDLLAADSLHKLFDESPLVNSNGIKDVIVTSHYGGITMAEHLDLSDLFGHDVTLIPETSRHGMLKILDLANKCGKAGARNVFIYPCPLVSFGTEIDLKDISDLSDPWERELLSNIVALDKVESPFALHQKIIEQALSPHAFIAWGKKLGFFKSDNIEIMKKNIDVGFLMNVVNVFPCIEKIDEKINTKKWDLDDIISIESRTILWSPTNVGKSLFALHLALALAYKSSMTVFEANRSRRIVIFDGETGQNQWDKRINALHGKHLIDVKDKDNFWVMHKKGNDAYADFDLFSNEWQERLLDAWKQHGIEVFILDNIMSLCPEVSKSEARAKEFFKFITRIESSGIAVLIIHHSNKGKEDMKGVYELEALSQNIISLLGRESFVEDKDLPTEVKNYLNDTGALCKCVFTKCKIAPELEHKAHYFHLPMNRGKWINLVNEGNTNDTVDGEIDIEETNISQALFEDEVDSQNCKVAVTDEIGFSLDNLSTDAHKLFLHIKKIPTKKIKRIDVEKFLDCAEDKARTVINELKKANILDSVGSGRNTYYQLR